jgi:hypothetical protein
MTCGPPNCVNLKAQFGDPYRIALESSHAPGERIDPWHYIIPGRYGHVYPFGGELLCVYTDHRRVKTALKAVLGGQIWQEGDWELVVKFHVSEWKPYFRAIRCNRKRRISPEQLARLRAARAARIPLAPSGSEITGQGRQNATSEEGTSVQRLP